MSHKRKKQRYAKEDTDEQFESKENIDDNTDKEDESKENTDENKISAEDLQSLNLLSLQLKGILIDIYAGTLSWNATLQGISYILEKYDNIEGNEHTTTLAPDLIALQGAYISLSARLLFINIAFTRFNSVAKKKAEGTFKYSLQPNKYINIACVLSLIVTLYFIKAGQGIVARDNIQPIFGNV